MLKTDIHEYKERDYHFIQNLIREELKPFIEKVADHHLILNGDDLRSGMVRDVNDIKTTVNVFRWLLSTFGILTVINFLKGLMK